MKSVILFLLRFYKKFVSPALPRSCRFYPSCSEYAHEAVETHGLLRGTALSARRVLKCHPYNRGGYDPVPTKNRTFLSGERKVTKRKPLL